MKHLLTAIACCLAVAGSAQSDAYPFNPDSDGDGLIGVADLLALLSDFGMDAEVQTCFKGEICHFYAQQQSGVAVHQDVPATCGTIIGQTFYLNSPGGTVCELDLSNEGYDEGDVLHFYLHWYSSNVSSILRVSSIIDGVLTQFMSIGYTANQIQPPSIGRAIFNGTHWEQLD